MRTDEEKQTDVLLEARKMKNQKKMAWAAMVSMIIVTGLLLSPYVSVERVNALSDLVGLFYLGQAGVVGAYMGFTSWMTRR